jgi:hypothetical protein
MLRNPKFKPGQTITPLFMMDTDFLGFHDHGGGEYQSIAAAATFTGHGVVVNGANQFTLFVYIHAPGAVGSDISRIAVRNTININWKPTAAANRNHAQEFNLVDGPITRDVALTYTFGIYSNTTLDLLASSPSRWFNLAVIVENTDSVTLEYTTFLHGEALQGSLFTEQVL